MLKMPTGFDASHVKATLSHPLHAGLEQTRTCQCQDSRPYCLPFSTRVQVLKSPFFATEAWFPAWLTPPATPLSNVIVPIRPATETSRSRAELAMKNSRGSFWGGAHSVLEQQQFDDHVLSTLMVELTRQNVPVVLLSYPRHVLDADYCADKLSFLRARYGVSYSEFVQAHRALSNASYVHSGNGTDSGESTN